MSAHTDWLLVAAAYVGAIVTLAAALWWLAWPRLEDKLQELVRGVARVDAQLSNDDPDTISRHARVAADAAAELPAIREQVDQLLARQLGTDEWRRDTDRRLTSVEGALLALLGPELRRRLFDDLSPTTTTGEPRYEANP